MKANTEFNPGHPCKVSGVVTGTCPLSASGAGTGHWPVSLISKTQAPARDPGTHGRVLLYFLGLACIFIVSIENTQFSPKKSGSLRNLSRQTGSRYYPVMIPLESSAETIL